MLGVSRRMTSTPGGMFNSNRIACGLGEGGPGDPIVSASDRDSQQRSN